MHIEVGVIDTVRMNAAHAAAAGVMAAQSRHLLNPVELAKTVLAGMTFSVLMQIWHAPVGPSELHIIGATSIYLLFGFAPSLLGFGVGLFLQAVLFGFWLMISNDPAPLADWLRWAVYYLPVFAAEAVLTFVTVKLLWLRRNKPSIARLTDIPQLRLV